MRKYRVPSGPVCNNLAELSHSPEQKDGMSPAHHGAAYRRPLPACAAPGVSLSSASAVARSHVAAPASKLAFAGPSSSSPRPPAASRYSPHHGSQTYRRRCLAAHAHNRTPPFGEADAATPKQPELLNSGSLVVSSARRS